MTTTVALGEIVDFYSGGTPSKTRPEYWAGSVPWFSAKDIKKPRLTDSVDHVSEKVFRDTSLRKVPAGTVVLVVRGMILAHTVPISVLDTDAAINQDLKALLPKIDIDTTYLAAMLRAQHADLISRVSTAAHGTTKLETRVLAEVPIPLPPVEEQRRIAAILDQADAIRTKRGQLLAHLDDLTRSTFYAMFGDGSRLPTRLFRDVVAELEGGKSLVADDSSADTQNRVLKISAVTSNYFRPQESKPLPDSYRPPASHFVRRGDLLFSRANTTELVGAVALVDVDVPNLVLPDKIWRFVWSDAEAVEPVYVWKLLQTPGMRRALSSRSSGTGGSMKNISKSKLQDMPVPLPSIEDQREFASRVAAISALRSTAEDALSADEELFASLQSRAFRGEL